MDWTSSNKNISDYHTPIAHITLRINNKDEIIDIYREEELSFIVGEFCARHRLSNDISLAIKDELIAQLSSNGTFCDRNGILENMTPQKQQIAGIKPEVSQIAKIPPSNPFSHLLSKPSSTSFSSKKDLISNVNSGEDLSESYGYSDYKCYLNLINNALEKSREHNKIENDEVFQTSQKNSNEDGLRRESQIEMAKIYMNLLPGNKQKEDPVKESNPRRQTKINVEPKPQKLHKPKESVVSSTPDALLPNFMYRNSEVEEQPNSVIHKAPKLTKQKLNSSKVEDRLIQYGIKTKEKHEQLLLEKQQQILEKENSETSQAPAAKKTKKDKDTYTRLYEEGMRKEKEKIEVQNERFKKLYPFSPAISNSTKKDKLTKIDIEKQVERLLNSRLEIEEKTNKKRKDAENFDPETKQKLFTPKLNPRRETLLGCDQPHIDFYVHDSTEFFKKTRELFDFLDQEKDGFVFIDKLNMSSIHHNCLTLVTPIVLQLIREKRPLSFEGFYVMIKTSKLERVVEEIFEAIEAQNKRKINPPMKFSN